ncbi:MAG: outer membrane beta-barrel protein [Planctomycetota bacterium]|nr:outer membrane beta-barrel protein [Planctomycetota bacterium]
MFQSRSPFKLSKLVLALSAVGMLALPSMSFAAEEAAADEDAPLSLLQDGLGSAGLKKPMDDLGLKVYGWAEFGYTYNMNAANNSANSLRSFDYRDNDFTAHQAAFNIERALPEGKDFAIGGKIELMYGHDMGYIHSVGMMDNNTDYYQFDPTQFYALFRLPVGEGLTVKVGKYVTPMGVEVIDAPGNALYSHGDLFNFAIPLTHTGIQFDYALNDKIGVYYGVVFGVDQFRDTNGTLSHMAGGSIKVTDKLTGLLNVITGPENAPYPSGSLPPNPENTDYRTVVDAIINYSVSDNLSLSLNGDIGYERFSGPERANGTNGAGDWWQGVAAYATYTITPKQLATTVRVEYFRDATATRTGTGVAVDLFEVTAGLDIHPLKKFQNLRLRPEVRWDHAFGDEVFDAGNTKKDQVTFATDVIITY